MDEYEASRQKEAQKYFEEGFAKQSQGEVEDAIECYQKSIEVIPTAEAFTFLGWAYSLKGNFEQAIQECRQAIEIDPEFGNPYNDIGAYLIEQGNIDEAISWLEKATQAARYDAYFYPYYNLGRIWEQKGDWQKAFAHYNRSLEFNSGYTLAHEAVKRLQGMMN